MTITITATEAKELVAGSKRNIERILALIDKAIRKAAEEGRTSIILEDEMPYDKDLKPGSDRALLFTPVQCKLGDAIQARGFSFQLKTRKVQVGGGLGSMGEEPYEEDRTVIIVSW